MKHRKKLRRVAMLALVLVLLCNTLGVNASIGAPNITVYNYGELVTARQITARASAHPLILLIPQM